jgi:hypothetical protein
MPHRVKGPDGVVHVFPDDATDAEISAALDSLQTGPRKPAAAEDYMTPNEIAEAKTGLPLAPSGSAIGRTLSSAAANLNPIAAVKGIVGSVVPEAWGGTGPEQAIKNIYQASADQWEKVKQAKEAGHYSEMMGHLGGMIPIIGPAAVSAGEQGARGDIAGMVGSGLGLIAPAAIPAGTRAVTATTRAIVPEGLRASIADSLASRAASNVADVMTPKYGANKPRFAGMAERVAPEIAADPEMAAWSRQGLHQAVQTKLAAAEQGLDAASDARLEARAIPTQPIIDSLIQKRQALTAEAVDASKPTPVTTTRTSPIVDAQGNPVQVTSQSAAPYGKDVVPGPNQPRVAQIDAAIAELKKLGPTSRYEDLRTIRQAYDGPAKAIYNPSMTQDFLKAQGGKMVAADVTGTLRDTLAKADPETAKANATYSLYRTANDVLDAISETEKTRPQIGRKIMARLTGTLAGEQAAGVPGAAVGWLVGPAVDSIASMDWTTKLKFSQLQTALATAIRGGDEGGVITASTKLKKLVIAAQTGRTTNPSAPQTSPGWQPIAGGSQ